MRNVRYMIDEARRNTNTTDAEAISDFLCISLLNRCLNHLCNILYNSNVRSLLFRKEFEYEITPGVKEYDLPFDIYAGTGVINLSYRRDDNIKFIPQIADKNKENKWGYVLYPRKIRLNPGTFDFNTLVLAYAAKPPLFGIVCGTIETVNANSIELAAGYKNVTDFDEYFCIVDLQGNIVSRGILADQAGDTLQVSDTTDIQPGMVVVAGEYATTHCPLEDEIERPLISMLEVLILARLSSKDIPVSEAISSSVVDQLTEMFADPSADSFTPPEMEYQEWLL